MSVPRAARILGRLPWGFLGMLAAVAAIESRVSRHEESSYTMAKAAWCDTVRASTEGALDAPVLCFGDSLPKFGIDASQVRDASGRPAYNLASFGGSSIFSYFMLRRNLEAGGKPDAVIYSILPTRWASVGNEHLNLWQATASLRECVELARVTGDIPFFGQMVAGKYLATFRNRWEIRKSLMTALNGLVAPPGEALVTEADRANWKAHRGGHLVQKAEWEAARYWAEDKYCFPDKNHIDPTQAVFMERFLRLAREKHIKTILLLPPIIRPAHESREQRGYNAQANALMRRIQDKFPDVLVLDARESIYPDNHFMDNVHLNARGASRLSQEITAFLQSSSARPDASRSWVRLVDVVDPIAAKPSAGGATLRK